MTIPPAPGPDARTAPRPATDTELLSTLFELGREVTAVLDLEDLLARIPQLIARLTRFSAFSVYLLDEKRQELRIAYAVGYPEGASSTMRLKPGQGVVGAAVEEGRPILVNDIRQEPRYLGPLHNMLSQLAVPMRRKGRVIGALNLLNEAEAAFTSQDEALLRQFAAHVAVAIENARLFRSERQYVDTLETLAEIGREMSSILDLDALLTRIASLTKRLIDYRTFGILLVNEETGELEMKLAVRYGKGAETKHVKLGEGLVGWSALHKEAVLVSDVSTGPTLHQLGRGRALRAGDPDAVQGSVHRRVRPREPGAGRVHQGAQGAADPAGQPGGGGDRERAAVRAGAAQRGAVREGAALRAARADGAVADRAAAAAGRSRRGRQLRGRPRARRRPLRFPAAGAESAGGGRGRRVGQGRAGGDLRRVCRGAGARAHHAPALLAGAVPRLRRAGGDEHDAARAPARGVLLHAVLRAVRLSARRRHPVEFRSPVSDSLLGHELQPDRAARRCRWARSPA